MKIRSYLLVFASTAFLVGCANKAEQIHGENKPRHAERVQIAVYDESAAKSPTEKLEIFDETSPIQRKHKDVALLTCEGTPREESEMTTAIIYRARKLGADALIILQPARSGWGDRRVFRAKAVIYEPL
jgi:hypothetical protein